MAPKSKCKSTLTPLKAQIKWHIEAASGDDANLSVSYDWDEEDLKKGMLFIDANALKKETCFKFWNPGNRSWNVMEDATIGAAARSAFVTVGESHFTSDMQFELWRYAPGQEDLGDVDDHKLWIPTRHWPNPWPASVVIEKSTDSGMQRLICEDSNSELQQSIENWFKFHDPANKPGIYCEFIYPTDFPHKPPLVYIVKPRFQPLTGHVTQGGWLCHKRFTTGTDTDCWNANATPNGVFAEMLYLLRDSNAVVDLSQGRPYTREEAEAARIRAKAAHGWS